VQAEDVSLVELRALSGVGSGQYRAEHGRPNPRSFGRNAGGRWGRSLRRWVAVALALGATWATLFLVAGCSARRSAEELTPDPGPGIVWGESHITIGVGPGGVTLGLSAPRAIESRSSLPSDASPSVQAGRWVQDVDGWPVVR